VVSRRRRALPGDQLGDAATVAPIVARHRTDRTCALESSGLARVAARVVLTRACAPCDTQLLLAGRHLPSAEAAKSKSKDDESDDDDDEEEGDDDVRLRCCESAQRRPGLRRPARSADRAYRGRLVGCGGSRRTTTRTATR
jgi:hypothetical protein